MDHHLTAVLARIGMQCLDEAVMAVVVAAQQAGEVLGPAEISKRTGIDRNVGFGRDTATYDDITTGVLARLVRAGRVSRSGRGRYEPRNH